MQTSFLKSPTVRCGCTTLLLALWFTITARVAAQAPETIEETVKKLTEMHQSGRSVEAQEFTKLLLKGDRARAAEVLGRLLNREVKSRSEVVVAIEQAGLKEAAPILIQLLADPESSFRHVCARALGSLGDKAAIAALERRLAREPDRRIQEDIRLTLARLGRPYLQYFLAGLTDRDPGRRRWCMSYLGQLKDPRAVPQLMKLLASDEIWDVLEARECLSRITDIPEAVVIRKTTAPDGRVIGTESQRRPLGEFKQDCEGWIERHAKEVGRPIEPAPEAWRFTAEPMLPGIEVSFAMSPDELMAAYQKAGIECTHSPAKRDGTVVSRESVGAPNTPFAALNERLLDRVWFTFENGKLASINLPLCHARSKSRSDILAPLMEALRLTNPNDGDWTGLDGTIQLSAGRGNAEGETWTISLRTGR